MSDAVFERLQGFVGHLNSDLPLAGRPEAKAQEFTACEHVRHGTFAFVKGQVQVGVQPFHQCHDALARSMAAYIDIAVIGVPYEAVAPSLQLDRTSTRLNSSH